MLNYALSIILLATSLAAHSGESDKSGEPGSIPLKFCYEDKQLLPYYTGDSDSVQDPPGATIEHLRKATALLPQITLKLQRKPWLRCLQLLEQNKVDAVVATFETSRQQFAVYPFDAEGKPDASLAMSQHATCLVQRPGSDVFANTSGKTVVVARPLGYITPTYPAGITVLPVQSQQQAFNLVKEGRVDATSTLCEVNQIPLSDTALEGLQLNFPPLYQTTGYLIFSKQFHQQHPALTQALWQSLAQSRDAQRYFEYLQYGAQLSALEQP